MVQSLVVERSGNLLPFEAWLPSPLGDSAKVPASHHGLDVYDACPGRLLTGTYTAPRGRKSVHVRMNFSEATLGKSLAKSSAHSGALPLAELWHDPGCGGTVGRSPGRNGATLRH